MTNELTTYYIPNNPNITKGPIYALYLNKNTNLDLAAIINTKSIIVNNITQSPNGPIRETSNITISSKDYTKLLELNNRAYELTNKRTANIQAFIQAENQTSAELAQINTERQELINSQLRKDQANE